MEKNLITPSISTIKNIWLRACGYPPGYDLFANSVINAFPHGFPQFLSLKRMLFLIILLVYVKAGFIPILYKID